MVKPGEDYLASLVHQKYDFITLVHEADIDVNCACW